MDQSIVPDWSENICVNLEDLELDHITSTPTGQPDQYLQPYDESLGDVHPSLRYLSTFTNPHSDFLGLAGSDLEMQHQGIDMPAVTKLQLNDGPFHSNGAFVPPNDQGLQELQGPMAHEGAIHQRTRTTTSAPWPQQPFNSFFTGEMYSSNEPSTTNPRQHSTQEQMNSPFSSISNFTNLETSSLKSKISSKRAFLQPSAARNRKSRMRRSPQRGSTLMQKKNGQAAITAPRTLDGSSSDASTRPGTAKTRKIEPKEAIALFEASIQPFSTFSQLKAADLISQLKQLVLEEEKYGRSSRSVSSDVNDASTASSTQDSVSNSEMVDSESLTDQTSVSSTPRQPIQDTDDSMSVEDDQCGTKHEPCLQCEVKPLFHCTWKNCGHSTHSFTDYKRHEAGDKHWPQDRFMCLQCTGHSTPTINGEPLCEFCLLPLSLLVGNMRGHFLQCEIAKKAATTFSRKDHLIFHLRKDHGMENMNKTIDAWKYGIDSRWPRQCGFCGELFQSWNERMNHLKKHFETGSDISTWKLPFPRSNDFRPFGSNLTKDNDDDDEDDSHHGGSGGSRTKAGGQPKVHNITPPTQSQGSSSRGNQQPKSTSHAGYRKAQATAAHEPSQDTSLETVEHGKKSVTLERYLNDTEEPISAPLTLGKSDSSMSPKVSGTSARNAAPMGSCDSILRMMSITPGTKVILKSPYQRPKRPRVFCEQCCAQPDGFRGEHELRRHKDREHNSKTHNLVLGQPPRYELNPQHVSVNHCNDSSSREKDEDFVCYELPASETFVTKLENIDQGDSKTEPTVSHQKEACVYELPCSTITQNQNIIKSCQDDDPILGSIPDSPVYNSYSVYPEAYQYIVAYESPYVDACKDFVEFCKMKSNFIRALEIDCCPWASEDKGTPAEKNLFPSWIPQWSGAPYAMDARAGVHTLKMGRKNADTLVGLPTALQRNYNAAETRGINKKAQASLKAYKPDPWILEWMLVHQFITSRDYHNILGANGMSNRVGALADRNLEKNIASEGHDGGGRIFDDTCSGKTSTLETESIDTIDNVKSKIHFGAGTACSWSIAALEILGCFPWTPKYSDGNNSLNPTGIAISQSIADPLMSFLSVEDHSREHQQNAHSAAHRTDPCAGIWDGISTDQKAQDVNCGIDDADIVRILGSMNLERIL